MKLRISAVVAIAAFAVAGVLGSTQGLAQNAYITNYDSESVSVINTRTNAVIATVPVGVGPWGVAVSPDGRRVYVANNVSSSLSVIDATSNTVIATVNLPYALEVAVNADGSRVYVTNLFGDLAAIDAATYKLTSMIPAGPGPWAVAVANKKIYVANSSAPATVTVIDEATDEITGTIPVGPTTSAPGLAASSDGRRVYVSNQIATSMPIIDTTIDTVVDTIPLGISESVAVSPDSTIVYMPAGNHIHGYDVVTDQFVVGSDYVGGIAGISVTPDGRTVYAANYNANVVFAIDTASSGIIATIPVGNSPLAYGDFIQARPTFAGIPGKANCHGQSISALTKQYGGLNNAAAKLAFDSVNALQNAIMEFCEG
jgi:YVTN family beta-propeller protein